MSGPRLAFAVIIRPLHERGLEKICKITPDHKAGANKGERANFNCSAFINCYDLRKSEGAFP